MRQNVAFVAVLACAAGAGALLVMPGRRTLEIAPPPSGSDAVPTPPEPPPRPKVRAAPAPPAPTVPAYVRVDPEGARACGEHMALVDGMYCPYVGHRCAAFEDEAHDVCKTFAPEALCEGGLQRRRFCVDVFEYPNVAGARPAVWASFEDAKRACAVEGKRLCAAEEWELACEGTGMWPYPYGLTRDAAACNEHRSGPVPDASGLDDPWKRGAEIARVDGRLPSGAQPACVSPFGVYDLPGNVEEWVDHANGNEKQKPFRTARKGGSWSRGKGRCRPIEASEPGWYRAHDLGFRCCADAVGQAAAVSESSARDRGAAPRKKRVLMPSPL
jgi:sulfatase modifying factor 1